MPKVKTHSAAKKRFKKVGSNKKLIKRFKCGKRHLLTKKARKSKRHMRKSAYINPADRARIAALLPY